MDAPFDLAGTVVDPVAAVRAGLPFSAYVALRDALGVSDHALARLIATSERTLQRRRRQGRLAPDESDRVLLLSGVFALAARALDGEERAAAWLATPHALFGGETALEYMDTLAGVEEVRTALLHIEHGMPV
jgi:putative toxin-antitoxin system antitoxin component (TIGR02293 family)